MTSLGFDLLDRHVVAGRADHLAAGGLSYARLLERTAALGTGLRLLGVSEGDHVDVRVEGDDHAVVVCACIRIGALPSDEGAVSVVATDDGAEVRAGGEVHPLDLVRRAGSGDPAVALAADAPGYREAATARVPELVAALLEGRSA